MVPREENSCIVFDIDLKIENIFMLKSFTGISKCSSLVAHEYYQWDYLSAVQNLNPVIMKIQRNTKEVISMFSIGCSQISKISPLSYSPNAYFIAVTARI